jgi:hypothetical protein
MTVLGCLLVVLIVVVLVYAFATYVQVAPNIRQLVTTLVVVALIVWVVVVCWGLTFHFALRAAAGG